MITRVTLPEEERPREPSASAPPELERLEYGKFCETREGRIENKAEHRLLGWSSGFPTDLVKLCSPARIGISSDAFCFDDASPDAPRHGTLLRPVVSAAQGGRPLSLLCRVRMRPEDGEGGRERRYTTARYIVDPAGRAGPLHLLGAMEETPLWGVTREDVTPRLAPLPAGAAAPWPEAESDLSLFLRGAIVYLLSGIPISVAEFVPEREFFGWVAALWRHLPKPLRPYLSAGWAVGGQLSGSLMVSYATRRAETCAVYSHSLRKWTPPPRVAGSERGARGEEFDRHILPGRAYAREVFESAGGAGPRRPRALDADAYLASKLAQALHQQAIDMREPLLVEALRLPGFRLLDAQRLDAWRRDMGDVGDGRPYRPSAGKFMFDDNAEQAFEASVEALEDERTRPRADRGVWSFAVSRRDARYAQFLAASGAAWAPRAKLLVSAAQTDAARMLASLRDAAEEGQAEGLPPEAIAALHEALGSEASLGDAAARATHARLLYSDVPPAAYVDWLRGETRGRANHFRLALGLLEDGGPGALDAAWMITGLTGSPAVEALWSYAGEAPPEEDAAGALKGLDETNLGAFLANLIAGWDVEPRQGEDLAARREFLLAWMRALPREFVSSWLQAVRAGQPAGGLRPGRLTNPINPLILIEVQAKLPPDAVKEIIAEVERRGVPASLLDDVASLTVKRWDLFGERVEQKCDPQSPWAQLVARWPDEFTKALLLPTQKRPAGEEPLDVAEEAVQMRSTQIEKKIEHWYSKELRRRMNRDVAHLLWMWAARALDERRFSAKLADICRGIEKEKAPPKLEPPTEADLETAIRLAREAGVHLRLADSAHALWSKARDSWHFRLLLGIFEEVDFEAPFPRVEKLVPYREWLRTHLRQIKDVNPERWKRFRVATLEFHEVSFPGRGDLEFRDEYVLGNSVLWAAFSGVPLEMQGRLSLALECYGGDAPKRSGLCRRYLTQYSGTPEYERALKKVLSGYLLPMLRQNYSLSEVERIFGVGGEDGYRSGVSITQRWRRQLDQDSENLLSEIMNADRRVIESALRGLYMKTTL